jgi:putative ABC transport system permease protein
MQLLLSYSLRNLWTRRLTTLLAASGMALVVFVFASILMLAGGLQKTLVETGSDDNVVIIRKGSGSEVQSGVTREQAAVLETQPEAAMAGDGKVLLAKEVVVLVGLLKRGSGKPSNVIIRGGSGKSVELRPQVKLVTGRMPRSGSTEIIAGRSAAERFQGARIGETLRFAVQDWAVVGIFDAGNTGFSSEIWGDGDQLMQAFRRPVYSSIIFKLREPSQFESFKARVEGDPRLGLEAKRETRYYAEQSEMLAKFLRILGLSLTVIFSLGAMIGAMITMYGAVSNRTGEIGTLRAIGFRRRTILATFIVEALLLGFLGGLGGLLFASFLQFFTVSTVNFQTFSELAFAFSLDLEIVCESILFSLVMGLAGGLLPAARASRMNIVDALRAV